MKREPLYKSPVNYAAYGALATIALLVGYVRWNNPSVAFRSSDGQWADSEVVFKGRTFKDVIVPEFEMYKLECSAPHATLLRTDAIAWYDVFAWPSYLTNLKWRVPYAKPNPALDDYHADCLNSSIAADWNRANAEARQYINSLR
ncbi:MAG TPA: hypothetical protein VMD53_19705 [Rhizomicrobium sp.]|nr:hypothetical protein [Rhizomicrobium sp.]